MRFFGLETSKQPKSKSFRTRLACPVLYWRELDSEGKSGDHTVETINGDRERQPRLPRPARRRSIY